MSQQSSALDVGAAPDRAQFGGGMVTINQERCQACGLCVMICPVGLFEMVGEAALRKSHVREGQDNCIACSCCEAVCEPGAIRLSLPYDHGDNWKQLDRGELSAPRLY